jgi:N-acetylglucosamine kinase-like BadF-type ATPase
LEFEENIDDIENVQLEEDVKMSINLKLQDLVDFINEEDPSSKKKKKLKKKLNEPQKFKNKSKKNVKGKMRSISHSEVDNTDNDIEEFRKKLKQNSRPANSVIKI